MGMSHLAAQSAVRGTRWRGMRKDGSSTLRPESLRKTTRAFNAPVNVQEGLREDSGRSEERGGEACSNTDPPRSALNPCGKQPGHSMRRSMFRRGSVRIRDGAWNAVEPHAQTRLLHAPP